MKLTERLSLATACLNLALFGCLIAANMRVDAQGKEQLRAMQVMLGAMPETVPVYCKPSGCRCTPVCSCCRCGSQ